jgi:hypothetical protein
MDVPIPVSKLLEDEAILKTQDIVEALSINDKEEVLWN